MRGVLDEHVSLKQETWDFNYYYFFKKYLFKFFFLYIYNIFFGIKGCFVVVICGPYEKIEGGGFQRMPTDFF